MYANSLRKNVSLNPAVIEGRSQQIHCNGYKAVFQQTLLLFESVLLQPPVDLCSRAIIVFIRTQLHWVRS